MKKNMILCVVGLICLVFVPRISFAGAVARLISVTGNVDVTRPGQSAESIRVGAFLNVGDIVRTKTGAKAVVRFSDGSTLRIGEKTRVEISEFVSEKKQTKGILNLFRGKIFSEVRKTGRIFGQNRRNRFEVHTPTAVVGVRGTKFITYYQEDISGAIFQEGAGYCYNRNLPNVIRYIQAGQAMTLANPLQPPVIRPFSPSEMNRHMEELPPVPDTDSMEDTWTEMIPQHRAARGQDVEPEEFEGEDMPQRFMDRQEEGYRPEEVFQEAGQEYEGYYEGDRMPMEREEMADRFQEGPMDQRWEEPMDERFAEHWDENMMPMAEDADFEGMNVADAMAMQMDMRPEQREDTDWFASEDAMMYPQLRPNGHDMEPGAFEDPMMLEDVGDYYGHNIPPMVEDTMKPDDVYGPEVPITDYLGEDLIGDNHLPEVPGQFDYSEILADFTQTNPSDILPQTFNTDDWISIADLPANGTFLDAQGNAAGNLRVNKGLYYQYEETGNPMNLNLILAQGTFDATEEAFRRPFQHPFDGWTDQGMQWHGFNEYQVSEKKYVAKGYQAWVDLESFKTGVAGGKMAGLFDPGSAEWRTAEMWAMVETEQLFYLAATENGRKDLRDLNIPSVQVGRADLYGARVENGVKVMGVMMKDVTFLAYNTGDAPSIWATDLVYGTYLAPPKSGDTVALSGGGLSAQFTVKQWNNQQWAASVAGSGSLERVDVTGTVTTTFKGGAAGTYSGTTKGGFIGTATGVAGSDK